MKISLWSVGKQHDAYVKAGIEAFTKRLNAYFPTEWVIIPPVKNTGSIAEQKKKEGEAIRQRLKADDYLIALDEHGKQLSSEDLSALLESRTMDTRQIVFLIGGAYGIDESILAACRQKWSLSKLTFPHQLVRLILAEQLYRACTIRANEKYHHR